MGFHYLRTPWEGGGVCRMEGEPAGARLGDLLRGGLPPTRVALELVVAMCEILYIAQEDDAVHGDLGLEHAWLNGDGTVSLGGFGPQRRVTRAPEGSARGVRTDLYGLGRLCAAVLVPGSAALAEVPFTGANAHDEAVRAIVGPADLGVEEAHVAEDLRWFLARLLSFDLADRPDALRVWKAMVPLARSREGLSLETWAMDAHRGVAARREGTSVEAIEQLGGAKVLTGPLSQGLRFSDPGYKTRTWTMPAELRAAQGPGRTRDVVIPPAEAGVAGIDRGGKIGAAELRALVAEAGGVPEGFPGKRRREAPVAPLVEAPPEPVARPAEEAPPAPRPPLIDAARAPARRAREAPVYATPVAEAGDGGWFGSAEPAPVEAPVQAPQREDGAIPWWLIGALVLALVVFVVAFIALAVVLFYVEPTPAGG
jgi:hypothetical protein